MKRIALFMHGGVAPAWSKQNVPGITALVSALAESCDVTVYTRVKSDRYSLPFSCGNATVRFVGDDTTTHLTKQVMQFVEAFRRDHHSNPYALVHGFWAIPGGIAAVLAAKISGIPSVVSFLGGEAAALPGIKYGNMRRPLSRMLTLWTARHADALSVLTKYQLDRLRAFGLPREENVHLIPLGVNQGMFPYAGKKPLPPPFHILHVGHLNDVKDQRTLLLAAQKVLKRLNCEIRIAGEGSKEQSLKVLAAELGISDRVHFLGFIPNQELHEHFTWAHVLLHSSLYEGQGVVFAEAAASGVPICGTRVGLLSDLGDSFAATAGPGDPEGLADAVVELLADPVRMDRLKKYARSWAESHDDTWSAERYLSSYDQLLNLQEVVDEHISHATLQNAGEGIA
jgi:glycosyltransferase involved in cell wall biosynthesis